MNILMKPNLVKTTLMLQYLDGKRCQNAHFFNVVRVVSTILSVILFNSFSCCEDCYTKAFFFFPTS